MSYAHTYIHTYIHTYDPSERAPLVAAFQQAGCAVHAESKLERILEKWSDQPADLLAAVSQPAEICSHMATIRQITSAPTVLVTHSLAEDTHVALYQAGADMVLLRPYSVRLLTAQAMNLAQRGRALPVQMLPTINLGALSVNPTTRTVHAGAHAHQLTAREFQLFYLFYTHPNQVLTGPQIVEQIWGYTGLGDENTVRNLISRLRKKLQMDGQPAVQIKSVAGVGYRLLVE
ncbi:MAG: response regulator transcription factor [Caldilineaceae bacterium]